MEINNSFEWFYFDEERNEMMISNVGIMARVSLHSQLWLKVDESVEDLHLNAKETIRSGGLAFETNRHFFARMRGLK